MQVLTAFSFPELEEYDEEESSMLQPSERFHEEEGELEMVAENDIDNDLSSRNEGHPEPNLASDSGSSLLQKQLFRTEVLADCSVSPEWEDAVNGK